MVSIRQAVAEDRFVAFRRDFYQNRNKRREVAQVVNMAYAQRRAPEAGSMMSFVVPMIFMVVIFYFLLPGAPYVLWPSSVGAGSGENKRSRP